MAKNKNIKKNNNLSNKNDKFKKYALVSTQIKAVIVDLFMLIMPLMYISIYLLLGGREGFALNMLLGWSYILIPYLIISIAFLVLKGQTPGLKAYEIKLVNNLNYKNASIIQVIIRQILSIIVTASIIGLLIPFFRKDNRTIQDIIASTAIILI
jgi:uncharacterized RDD family membrane protein YckC